MTFNDAEADRQIQQTLGEVVSRNGGMLVDFVLVAKVAEVDDDDADVGCLLATPDNARTWDTLGLLTYGLTVEQAGIHRREVE